MQWKGSLVQRKGPIVQLQAHDDARLEDPCRRWEQTQGVRVSTATMSRAIKRMGWTRKKIAGKSRTPRGRPSELICSR